jgi:hypothetical protein
LTQPNVRAFLSAASSERLCDADIPTSPRWEDTYAKLMYQNLIRAPHGPQNRRPHRNPPNERPALSARQTGSDR